MVLHKMITIGQYTKTAKTSIIICALNHLQDLTVPCINALLRNTQEPFELILIDDGSKDATFDYFRSLTRKAYRNQKPSGATRCRNIGLKASQGDYIAILDNDVTVPPGWLGTLIQESRNPKVGIIGPVLSNEMSNMNLPRSNDGLMTVSAIAFACALIKREVLNQIGLLDERLINLGEDTDFCFRAVKAGYRVAITPRLIVKHVSFATRRDVSRPQMDRSMEIFKRKYPGYGK